MMRRKNLRRDTVVLRYATWWLIYCMVLSVVAKGDDIFLEWVVMIDNIIKPVALDQPVITINGMFPGPLINASTNDVVHVNVYNDMDEPLLLTWNGIQQRLNSWQDGVLGTNCPILPGRNWTYVFHMKDQIGSFFYFPTTNFQRAGGGFGPIRIHNRAVIDVPFEKPEDEFDLLIGDWYGRSFKDVRRSGGVSYFSDWVLMNGKGPYNSTTYYQSFTVSPGKTYRFRISNVGNLWSFNFRIQNHTMLLVETEGSYTDQIAVDSLDVHVGQSYSVLVTANQTVSDYYIVATPKWFNFTTGVAGVAVLRYYSSPKLAIGPLPSGPDPFDVNFSIAQARSIRWNLTAGAARPNHQGTFNVSNVILNQTFVLRSSYAIIDGHIRHTVNNVSHINPQTPLKLADRFLNGSGVYELDVYPVHSSNPVPVNGTFVVSGIHKGWLELVFVNDVLDVVDSWHLDGYSFFVVGFGLGKWTPEARSTEYNLYDPVVRSTVQVYPKGWTAVYVYLDNPGMWNLRSQNIKQWYLGQELYIRVFDSDPNPAKEHPPPDNLMYCGMVQAPPPPPPSPSPPPPSIPSPPNPIPVPIPPPPPTSVSVKTSHISRICVLAMGFVLVMVF